MDCVCHGEPAYWLKDVRCKAGGWWRCAVAHRQDAHLRYDRDPVHRIGKNLRDNARRRGATLERRREAMTYRSLPE